MYYNLERGTPLIDWQAARLWLTTRKESAITYHYIVQLGKLE